MGRAGSVYRRCTGCRRRIVEARCPCGHGRFTWTFTVDVAPNGAATRQQVKRGGFARKQDALDAMQAELVDRRRGAHILPTKLSFGEYATTWLQQRAHTRVQLGQLAETTFAIYERDLRNHLMPQLGDVPLQQLDGASLTRHDARLLEHLSTKSIANVHGLAHRILHDAVTDGLLPHNPADRAVKPRAPETEQPTWTPAEVAAFLAYVREDDPDCHALFATIAVTGIRRGEAVGATRAATDLDSRTLEIRQTITKAGSKVIVKPPKSRRAGLPHIGGPHGLRHSLASALDTNGNGLTTIRALLGHASTAVTSKVYTHMLKGADRAAVDVHTARILLGLIDAGSDPR